MGWNVVGCFVVVEGCFEREKREAYMQVTAHGAVRKSCKPVEERKKGTERRRKEC